MLPRALPAPPRPRRPVLPRLLLPLLVALVGSAAGPVLAQDVGEASGTPAAPSPREPVDPSAVPRPTLAVGWTDAPVTLDGRLDEGAWARADVSAEPFWLAIPRQGVRQEFVTEVRVLQDADALYFGVELRDPDPAGIVTAGLEQDFETQDADVFGVALDTYHDRSNGFVWAINPEGAVFDAQAFNDSREVERAWEGVVETGARRHQDGWTLEMRIPFTTLRYRPSAEPQTWGMNLFRRVKRRNEDAMWAALPRQFRPYKFSLAGTLTGVRVGEPGRNLGVKPYALASATGGGAVEGATTGDVGVDVKWGVTPRLTLDATVNTDFSQVEVDQEQVNLTRFSLFFPEKRDFFLENDGTFAFQDVGIRNFRTGSNPRSFRLFHSRRIGLGPDRRPVPILGGVRLTGRVAGFEVGLLEMQTREGGGAAAAFPAENFAVARVRRDVGMGLTVGGIVVNRQGTSGRSPGDALPGEDAPSSGARPWNRAWGADLNWSPLREMVISAYGAHTEYGDGWAAPGDAVGGGGDRNAGMLQVAWRDPLWNTSLLLKHVGGGFDPGVGFVARRGVRRLFATVGAHPQPRFPGVVEVNPYVDADWFTNLDGVMETREITPGLRVVFADNGNLSLEYLDHFERLFAPLDIAGGTVAAGDYGYGEVVGRYTSDGGRALSGQVTFRSGGFFDGSRTSVGGFVQWRPDPRASFQVGFERNDLELGGEPLDADLYSLKASLARDTRTFLLGFVQYNAAAEELVANVRFNLIHAPLSDVFIVYTERRSLLDEGEVRLAHPGLEGWRGVRERGLTLKVTRLMAF